jgi:magnesium-transporting ATPase (P-type)
MIQSASIGVGIKGKEGNQAATFSDYSLPKFNGIHKLIFMHGRAFGTRAIPCLISILFKS